MAIIGVDVETSTLVLTKGRDFRWKFVNTDDSGAAIDYPSGTLFFELATATPLVWLFTITGAQAVLKIESTVVDTVPNRTKWQLVFKPTGELAGGDIVARGTVKVQI